MWIFTPLGFFSVVKLPNSIPGHFVQVRARSRKDLENLRVRFAAPETFQIVATPKADYAYRLYLPIGIWKRWISELASDSAFYSNFKDEVARLDNLRDVQQNEAPRARLYSKVWSVLKDGLQEQRRPLKTSLPGIRIKGMKKGSS